MKRKTDEETDEEAIARRMKNRQFGAPVAKIGVCCSCGAEKVDCPDAGDGSHCSHWQVGTSGSDQGRGDDDIAKLRVRVAELEELIRYVRAQGSPIYPRHLVQAMDDALSGNPTEDRSDGS